MPNFLLTYKNTFSLISKDQIIINQIRLFVFLLFLNFLILIWKWPLLPPQIPLFYSLPRSYEQLGNTILILIFPSIALIFFLINLTIATLIYQKEKLGAYLMITITTFNTLILFLCLLKIILLVT
jgi:hypothetical protein